jgi:hypothetical protein
VLSGRLLSSATAAAPARGATALTISSGSHTPSWMAFTRFTGALLGVKRSMVVMAASSALWAAQNRAWRVCAALLCKAAAIAPACGRLCAGIHCASRQAQLGLASWALIAKARGELLDGNRADQKSDLKQDLSAQHHSRMPN